jgi:hypothetical protein
VSTLAWSACGRQAQARWRTQLHRGAAQHTAAERSSNTSCRSFTTSKRKPRVVVIGWLGAQRRHFDKCAVQRLRNPGTCSLIDMLFDLGLYTANQALDALSRHNAGRAVAELKPTQFVHVDRYVQLWQRLGHETIAIRPPTPSILIPPVGDWVARDFLRQLQTAGSEHPQQPVVFHAFR